MDKDLLPPRPPLELLASTPAEVCAYIQALEKLLTAHVGLMKEQGARLSALEQKAREGKRQATPFRRKKKKGTKRKKPGRKPGHEPAKRTPPEPDEKLAAGHPRQCPCCQSTMDTVGSYTQTQEDIETVKRTRLFEVTVGVCGSCGERVEGRHPLQTSTARGAARTHLGPRALAIATQLHFGQGVPYDKVREHLRDLGISVSKGAVVRAMKRISRKAKTACVGLLEDVLSSDILHIDETGWSIDGQPCWLWVLSSGAATVYFVRKTRSSDEVADFLADFRGVLVTDGAKAYDKLGRTLTRALCLLHLRRNVKALEERQTAGAVRIPRAINRWLDEAIAFSANRQPGTPADLGRRVRLEGDLLKLLELNPTNAANLKIIERLRKWQDSVLRCIRDASVPATNNQAERMIRPAVVTRKRGGCSRSEEGARVFEVITSVLVSARQRGVNFVDWVVDLLRSPHPLLLPSSR